MKCIICWKEIEKWLRCVKCYCDIKNDEKTKEYMKKNLKKFNILIYEYDNKMNRYKLYR